MVKDLLAAPGKSTSAVKLNRSVQRVATLLKAFTVTRGSLTLTELGKATGLPESTVYRLLATLQEEGLVERTGEGHGRYRLGLELFRLGSAVLNGRGLGREIFPHVQALADDTGETVNLGVLYGFNVLYVHKIESEKPLRASLTIGSASVPAHCSANGKALLAHVSDDRLGRLMGSLPLERRGPNTITDRDALRRELGWIRERGYSVDDLEFADDIRAVAAPVRDHHGDVVAAIAVAGPATRFSLKGVHELAPRVISTAGGISAQLGHVMAGPGRVHEAPQSPLTGEKEDDRWTA